ncbi:uncharacterized protein F4812DRAFT_358001 [Daldinia caldariorum]|uniref:uncharacterized protein n=1 Tax=Daldinia caldariorum TaxID=326644 RepID=UPI002008DEE9|nr:uncharacterized protein F4812DRAFT_358001 [Daldinia caldariorum]KAI1468192.1 hypothetical protein F4812DRAFT_358001 [Daldinia caldariorum]
MQEGLEQKHTPNRRRQGGRSRNTPKQTTYASENDVPRRKSGHNGSPSTPISEGVEAFRASSTSQKPRSKKKKNGNKQPRPNDSIVSPGQNNPECSSPSAPIFAGSTFHASPAPSALPIPSFLNKFEPSSPRVQVSSSPEQELSCTTSDSDEASSPSPTARATESPLEFFFRADRAEKEKAKARRASASVHAPMINLSPLSSSHQSPKDVSAFSVDITPSQTRRPHYHKRATVLGISSEELDGNPGEPVGPAFSTPYQERMRAARSNQSSARSTNKVLQTQDFGYSDDLKRYLFTGRLGGNEEPSQQPPSPSNQAAQHHSPQHRKPFEQARSAQCQSPPRHLPRGMFPMSVLTASAQNGQPTTPPVDAQPTPCHSNEVTVMEDELRRILKLNPSRALSLH